MGNNDIVIELSMTDRQLCSLEWILRCWLKQYEDEEGSTLKEDAQGIYDALRG